MSKKIIKISRNGQLSGDDMALNHVALALNVKGRVLVDSVWCG